MMEQSIPLAQMVPAAHAFAQQSRAVWHAPNSHKGICAAVSGTAGRVLFPALAVYSGLAEASALPVRFLAGTSVTRQLSPPARENFMHRGALGFVGDTVVAGASAAGRVTGLGVARLVNGIRHDRAPIGLADAASRGARMGAQVGLLVQVPLEAVGAVLTGAMYLFTGLVGYATACKFISLAALFGLGAGVIEGVRGCLAARVAQTYAPSGAAVPV